MQDLAFYFFAALTLLFGFLVVFNPFTRNPVTSAMSLVCAIIGMAGLFVLLHAYFLAWVQVLVYAGAVIILFLFVIMLMDVKEEERRRLKIFGVGSGILAVGAIVGLILSILWKSSPKLAVAAPTLEGNPNTLGAMLFTQYLLPFEILSLILLVAMIGAILLSKKDLK
jgi:NADH-quinone oxidoreductase subunit J